MILVERGSIIIGSMYYEVFLFVLVNVFFIGGSDCCL